MTPFLRLREECILYDILKGTNLPEREPAIVANDTNEYVYDDMLPEVWIAALPFVEKNVLDLQTQGLIKYGAWTPLE
tara:strand:+ start:813 stop:1043 length:231 start_codon:yes stop_codon:yes gene_type:complete